MICSSFHIRLCPKGLYGYYSMLYIADTRIFLRVPVTGEDEAVALWICFVLMRGGQV